MKRYFDGGQTPYGLTDCRQQTTIGTSLQSNNSRPKENRQISYDAVVIP